MFRARERGMSFWPFAISLLAVIVLLVMWFGVSSERDEAKRAAANAAIKVADAEARLQTTTTQATNAARVVGWEGGTGINSADVEASRKEYAEKLKAATTVEFATKRYQVDPTLGTITKTEGEKVTVQYLTDTEINDTPTIQSFLSKVETATKRMQADLARFNAASGQSSEDKEKAAEGYATALREKDARIAALTGEKQALQNQMDERVRELTEKNAQKDQQLTAKDGDLEALRKQSSENEAKLLARNKDLDSTIRSLVQRDAPAVTEGADGSVLLADDGMAVIDRGTASWLMPGTIFDVWGRAKGGATYLKGHIKVTSCDVDTARCAILDQMRASDPITKGDQIQSLTYSPNRKLHFVLIGEFKKMGRSQAEAVLTKLGAIVDPKVTAETNYLVVGAGDNLEESEQGKAARDLGIRQITEDQLSSFTRY